MILVVSSFYGVELQASLSPNFEYKIDLLLDWLPNKTSCCPVYFNNLRRDSHKLFLPKNISIKRTKSVKTGI